MNDVNLLREAATRMRQLAVAANTDDARRPYGMDISPVPTAEWGVLVENYLGGEIGQHCASWHPAVALAVAEMLGAAAGCYVQDEDTGVAWTDCPMAAATVAIARAYLRKEA